MIHKDSGVVRQRLWTITSGLGAICSGKGLEGYGYWFLDRVGDDHGERILMLLLLLLLMLLLILFSLIAFERMLLEEKRKMISVLSSAIIFLQASVLTM
jgi:hypothetical protein